jgi:hypothetical protein
MIPACPGGSQVPVRVDLTALFNYCAAIFFPFTGRKRQWHPTTHRFIEEFDGFIGFGLNRESDMDTVIYYLQKFSDDKLDGTAQKTALRGRSSGHF